MTWIETWTGKQIHPLDPKPEDICLEDIAQGLSNKTRYNGQCEFYSVAEHCVLLADWCTKMGLGHLLAINMLLHDASEAYLPDVTSPIKSLFPQFADSEKRMLHIIFQALKIDKLESEPYLSLQKGADRRIILNEKKAIQPNGGNFCWQADKFKPLQGVVIKKWSPNKAKKEFTSRFRRLKRQL